MLGFSKLQIFSFIGVILLGLSIYAGFSMLISDNRALRADNISKEIRLKSKEAAIDELNRRDKITDEITIRFDKQRTEQTKQYERKVEKIDNDVKTGNDKEVGPVLSNFFNEGN